MDALRAAVAHLSGDVPPAAIAGAVATFAAAWARRCAGRAPVAPDPALRLGRLPAHGAGGRGEESEAEALELDVPRDGLRIGMNASTFTARVVTSTGSDAISSVVAAIGALKEPLHGGARAGPRHAGRDRGEGGRGARRPGCAERWIEAELAAGRRIMGMGRRIPGEGIRGLRELERGRSSGSSGRQAARGRSARAGA